MATAKQFKKLLLALPDTEEKSHMNHPDFRVKGKIFATLTEDERTAMLKLPPDVQASIVVDGPFRPATGAWGRAGCTLFEIADVPVSVITPLAEEAHRFTSTPAKKKTKKK